MSTVPFTPVTVVRCCGLIVFPVMSRCEQLTRVLEPCLNGTSKTLMILNVADAPRHRDTNLHSLRFGASVTSVVVKKATDKDIRAAKKLLVATASSSLS